MKADVVELEFRDVSRPVVPRHVWKVLAGLTPDPTTSKRIIR
jgi:hypothetical protein